MLPTNAWVVTIRNVTGNEMEFALTAKKSPGRPKIYGSSSEKVSAFRSRLQRAGYLRKEVLVTPYTETRAEELAKAHGVRSVDVYSALLEFGLQAYDQEAADCGRLAVATAQFVSGNGAYGEVAVRQAPSLAYALSNMANSSSLASAPANPGADPIATFFQKRKETLHDLE